MTPSQGKAQQTQTRALGQGKGAHELPGTGSMRPAEQSQVHGAQYMLASLLIHTKDASVEFYAVTCTVSQLRFRDEVRQT